MQYIITFLEGIISFISPCMLPMLPLYISYFAPEDKAKSKTVVRSAFFVLGFALTFSLLGLFAGALGSFLTRYRTALSIVCGCIIIVFGLSYLDVIKLPFFSGVNKKPKINSIFSAFLFGVIYSVSLTPCVGAFLGSALMMASGSGSAFMGVTLLLVYSLGLGIPFILSALLLDRLKSAFTFIKRHYSVINKVCGIFLIVLGFVMAMGWMNYLLSLFS